ncbi:tRNA (adenosine(37)-N6)-threonylcarbamoyltransferase complex dimerization subunit type 1 TsaB [Chamaesiphon sp. GL140_3_metabinner_50]|uniref:tRNA (adenosine(37)-N6)-threonylcarbamoyltransferase complex dimerization subunit type 1 TsaB n=1 Tax=Chamaesiphon sp. GL140_3_metabinner_50 TaxID=2970812 RepID=UPI0025E3A05B|nr:tRNA (adenosine(37)-N6)-threonylcarbamoyltransferase complex dimerization subunit type 1 TsaB [Chamaesiphon sp. GL140_3_metabinner_50]
MKYGLALHTSSPALGLAIGSNAEDVRCQTWDLGRDTSNYLHPYLRDFLRPCTWQDLDWIAVANGPGGFTGTRLGVVTARTLGQQLDIPVFAISSLAAIAWQSAQVGSVAESHLLGKIAVSMPAQRGEVFAAVYNISNDDRNLQVILPETVFLAADWDAQLAGYQPTQHIVVPQSANLTDTVVGVLALARSGFDRGERPHWSTALPFYGQHPVIEAAIVK